MTDNEELKIKPIRYTLRLADQLDKAITYLREISPKQAEIMGKHFFKAMRLLETMPGIGTKYKNGMRKIRLGKFRYNIFYREKENETEILGIWHTSRGTDFEEE
jgi:plasmid stabilization system protein ParE